MREEKILKEARTIAVVGASPDPRRHSHRVMAYLMDAGYRVIPVNPNAEEVLGVKTYPDLISIPEPVDIVDVFRAPEKVMPIVDEAVSIGGSVIWFQEGVINQAAADKAAAAGLKVVMDRCIAKTHAAAVGGEH